jgi:hypothetical protein
MSNRTTRKMAQQLVDQWEAAREGMRVRGSLADARYEQDCYDRLVEHCEQNGLNYSIWDPRGPKETDPDYS